jgi:hypothetical protein
VLESFFAPLDYPNLQKMSHTSRQNVPILGALLRPAAALFALILFAHFPVVAEDKPDSSTVFTKCWEYGVSPLLEIRPAVDATNAYVAGSENKLIGLSLTGGTKLWSADLGGEVSSDLHLDGDSIFVVTSATGVESNSVIWSISKATGITEWRTEIPRSSSFRLGTSLGNIITVGSDGVAAAFGGLKGDLIWRTAVGSAVTSEPHFDDSGILFGTSKNEIVNARAEDGVVEVVWKTPHVPTAIYFNSRSRLVIGDDRGNLYSVQVGGRRSWRFRNGARISHVLAYGDEYVAVSNDNFVYDISRSGDVRWKRRLPGRIAGEPLILGETLAVSIVGTGSVGTGSVYLLDLKNGKVLNRIETSDESSAGLGARPEGTGLVMTSPGKVTYLTRGACSTK